MIFEAEKSFPPRSNSNAPLLSESKQMQELLLDYGADPLRPCVGSSLDGDVPFDKFICSGSLQVALVLSAFFFFEQRI